MSFQLSLKLSKSAWVTISTILLQLIMISGILLLGFPYLQQQQDKQTADQIARHTVSAFWYSVSDLDLLCYEWTTRPELTDAIGNGLPFPSRRIFPDKICDELDIDILMVLENRKQETLLVTTSSGFAIRFPETFRENLFSDMDRLLKTSRYRVKHVAVLADEPFYLLCLPIRQPEESLDPASPSGYLIFGRHLDRSDAAKLSVLLQQTVSIECWSTRHPSVQTPNFGTVQGLAQYTVQDKRIHVTCSVPGLEKDTGLLLHVTAVRTTSPVIERIAWLLALLLLLVNSLVLLLNLRSREQIRRRLEFMLRIVNRISGRLFVQPKPADSSDEVEQLHAHLDNLFLNIQRMHKERELFHARDVIREKLIAAGRIAAELSHEILTPIRVIRNCLAPLERKLTQQDVNERDRKMFQLLTKELDEMEVLVRNLLQFFREGKIEGKPVRLSRILDSAIERFRTATGEETPVLRTRLYADAVVFVSDHQLEQVVLNLLQNAKDANCTEIRIESNIATDSIYIHVMDNGDGIPEHVQTQIFEPFFTRKKERGVGLGLNISYNIVRNYDGELYLMRDPDVTHFVIRLPMMSEATDETNHTDR